MSDMSDIVERLTDVQRWARAVTVDGANSATMDMIGEAIAEITRLRAALAAEREECAKVVDANASAIEAGANNKSICPYPSDKQRFVGTAKMMRGIATAIRSRESSVKAE